MKVGEARVGDVFFNPVDHNIIFLLASINLFDGDMMFYTWVNLVSGESNVVSDSSEAEVAGEWIILRGDKILQKSVITEEILEAVA